jgi:Cu-Zn family superoxide dismutase
MKIAFRYFMPVVFLSIVGIVSGCGDDSTPDATGGAGGSGGSAGAGGSAGGDAASDAPAETKIASTTGEWNVYRDPFMDGGTGPIATVTGSADAFSSGGKMRVKLTVSGLPPNRPFGSHIHKLDCTDNKAGGHYQNMPFPADGSASDPTYANNMNEVWLDFVTDAMGAATSEANVNWIPRAGEAKALMIHDLMTMTGGTAGAKLACISMPF